MIRSWNRHVELSRHMKPMRAGGNAVSALHIGDPELDSVASLLLRGIGNCARPVRSRAVTRPKTFHAKAPDLPGVLPLCSHRRRQVGHCNPPTKSGICLNRHPELQFRWFPPDAQGRHRSRIGGANWGHGKEWQPLVPPTAVLRRDRLRTGHPVPVQAASVPPEASWVV